MGEGTSKSEQFIVVKSWATVLAVLTLLVSVIISYTALRDQANETERRVQKLEDRPNVSIDMYVAGQDALKDRLSRIERKIDETKTSVDDSAAGKSPRK